MEKGGNGDELWEFQDMEGFLSTVSKQGGEFLQLRTAETNFNCIQPQSKQVEHALLLHRGLVAALNVVFHNPNRSKLVGMDFVYHFLFHMPLPYPRFSSEQCSWFNHPSAKLLQLSRTDIPRLYRICIMALHLGPSDNSPTGTAGGLRSWACQVMIKMFGETVSLDLYELGSIGIRLAALFN